MIKSITNKSYESMSDTSLSAIVLLYLQFFSNVAIFLIIIPQMVIHYDYQKLKLIQK